MNMKSISAVVSTLLISTSLFAQAVGQKKILWDCTHAETSGNGDWVIDADLHNMTWNPTASYGGSYYHSNPQQYPTPSQTTVVSSTAETYWEGSLSNWGIDCVNKGYWVETLPPTGQITYGSTTNAQDLSKYDVFVVDEPNIRFTQAEITAMMNFIENGGSLFAISDHTGSDRNNDGWDSPMIWNDFMTNNPVLNNAFGYTFALENFSGTSTNVSASTSDSVTHGPYGNVAEVQWSNGTCMVLNPSQNPSVKAHVWKSGLGQTDTAALSVTARWKCGKIASIGDSSPPDDGTGNPSVTLYNGYTLDAAGNHRPWLMNMMIWLAEGGTCGQTASINSVTQNKNAYVYPNPFSDQIIVKTNNESENVTIVINDGLGRKVKEKQGIGEITLNTAELPQGIYLIQIIGETSGSFTQKLIK